MRQIDPSVFIADGAHVIRDVIIGEHSSVWYNAVIRGMPDQITIGDTTNIQDLVMLHSSPDLPIRIGSHVTIGHSAIIHGCTIDDNALIGMGSIIMNGAHIGKNCIIGAGSLITQNTVIPDNSMAFGRPAKIIRSVTEEEIRSNRKTAEGYAEEALEMLRLSTEI
ncbi:MAG: gamma carbonic anhydrase family protein [Eubacteriales bacterium]|jgi:carbonic anhydrase/acetyltransferase-like protein (isoleucine patch superfamily)